MRALIYFMLLPCFLFIGCEEDDSVVMSISSGTSFGECLGYCVRLMDIEESSLSYVATGTDELNYPRLQLDSKLTAGEWEELVALIDMDLLEEYDDVVGCPDCADGGAEWIEVEMEDESKRILFEYGDTLASIQPLIDHIRALRGAYELELFAESG